MPTDVFHAVKEAALGDALRSFGLKGADAARRAGAFALTNHPLPNWAESLPAGFKGPPRGGSGYGPGIGASLQAGLRNGGTTLGAALGQGAKNTAKGIGHTVAETGRSLLAGDPLTMVRDLRGQATKSGLGPALGRYAKEFYAPSGLVHGLTQGKYRARAANAAMLGLNVGLPAAQLYGAVRHPDEANRGRAIGGALAGLATAPFTARMGGTLGVGLGALAGQAAQRAGGAVGGLFDRPRPAPPPPAYDWSADPAPR